MSGRRDYNEPAVFLDPNNLNQYTPAEVLDAAARGRLGLDHRFLHALLDRKEESLPALLAFAERDRADDTVDLAPELIAIFRHWKAAEAIPFYIRYIEEDPEEVPDEVAEALVALRQLALEPLLALYERLDETESSEVAFILAHLRIRDERILKLLLDRLEYNLSDTSLLLSAYGDPAAKEPLTAAAAELTEADAELKRDIANAIEEMSAHTQEPGPDGDYDIWADYPETDDLPTELLSEEERTELLGHPLASMRSNAAASFFNRELNATQRQKLLDLAQNDESAAVRARSWEALMGSTENAEVVDNMLAAMRRDNLTVEERGGLMVGLAPEVDRNEVRAAILQLYEEPAGRAKAMEAMWRSVHPSFQNNFAKHLNDADPEVRRSAIWGVGYFGLKSELETLRKFFDDEELRSDALFAYAMAVPAEVSRGRMKGLLSRIEKDAKGLSEGEEDLVKAALDERLMMAGKEPVFLAQED